MTVVAIAMHQDQLASTIDEADLNRLTAHADVRVEAFDGYAHTWGEPAPDPEAEHRLAELAADADVLIVAHGAPRVTAAVLERCPRLRFVGELQGDRFAGRIDVKAASERGIVVVDTTHGSSLPVAEFALAMMIFGLRDTARYVRGLTEGADVPPAARGDEARVTNRDLTRRRVGLIGFGHIAWSLVDMLRPFDVEISAHDPFAARELGDARDVSFGPLDVILSSNDVVVCLAPLTPSSEGMITEKHLRLLRPGSVFVNVSRGGVVDTDALVSVAEEGQVVFCLDVLEPEPVPVGHRLRQLPNVLLTPHLAGTTDDCRPRFFRLMVDEVLRHLEGLEPRAQITPRVMAGRHDSLSAQPVPTPESTTHREETTR